MARSRSSQISRFRHISWQPLLPLAIIALALYVVVPQFGQFRSSLGIIVTADAAAIIMSFLCICGAVLAASGAYRTLAFRHIPFRRIVLVQWAGMFINRLLPAGIGGMGLSADFLYRHNHSLGRATTVVVVNNLLGFLGHISIVMISLLFFSTAMPSLSTPRVEFWVGASVLFVAIAASLFVVTKIVRAGKILRFIRDIRSTLHRFRRRKKSLLFAYGFALINSTLHIFALMLVLAAFGFGYNFALAAVVLTGGVLAATVTPTPGGVLGSEAGLTVLLVAYGVPIALAFAVALTYRFVSYWIPMLPGIVAFFYARKRRYV